MRVVFDHLPLAPTSTPFGLTGVGRWTFNVLNALIGMAPEWKLEGLGIGARPIDFSAHGLGSAVGWKQLHFPRRPFLYLESAGLTPALETFVGPVDVMLGTAYVTRKTQNAAEIPVIYDLSFLKYPETHPWRRVWYLKKCLPAVLDRASMVVTISNAMKHEISSHYSFDDDRIAVAPPGCSPQSSGTKRSLEVKTPVEGDFLLAVGTIEPRKNLTGLLKAYGSLKKRRPDVPSLVVVGGMGWRSKDIQEVLGQQSLQGSVQWLGYVEEPLLQWLYSNAMGFIYPSFYEGFGMPIIEAMAAGCPVVTSIGSAMAEAGGDAALLVDPADTEQLEEAIERVVDDSHLGAVMRAKGLEHVKRFTWDRTAALVKGAIERAVSLKGSAS